MKNLILTIIPLVFASCKGDHLYNNDLNASKVVIVLPEFNLENVPDNINSFTNAERLIVLADTTKGWVIYPPASASSRHEFSAKQLTPAICELTGLKLLSLNGLELTSLPDCISDLAQLEILELNFNHLDLSLELNKLKGLQSLKEIRIAGNKFDKEEIELWRKEKPELNIIYSRTIPSSEEDYEARRKLEQFIYSYYETMSARDWEKYRKFFWPEATLTTVWQSPGDSLPTVQVNTIERFIEQTPEGPDSQPIFEETPTYITIDCQGDLATAWVYYEAKFGSEENLLSWKGTDLFTFMEHNGEWKIVSLAYSAD